LTVEELYVNAFDGTFLDWAEVGVSPYLHDTNVDYIYTAVNGVREGDWSFPASAGSGTINNVKLRFEARVTILDTTGFIPYVWDGSGWTMLPPILPSSTGYAWYESDVSAILNTWAKINAAKVRLLSSRDVGTVYVRRCTRRVDYAAAVKAKAGLHPSKPLAIILGS